MIIYPKKFEFFNPKFEYEKIYKDSQAPWSGHKFFIYDFIRNLKPKTIVELGTYKGTSIFSMTQAVKDENLDTKLYAIDTWKGDKHAGFYDESIFKEVEKIKNTFYSKQNLILLKTTFDKAKTQFKDKSIDILHIDGLHTYKAVKHDFDNWINKVKSDGIIIFHDISEKRVDFGVYKFWDELKLKYTSLEFHHSHGLGVLFLKPPKNIFFCFPDIWLHHYDKKYNLNICQINLIESKIENQNLTNQVFDLQNENNKIKKEKDRIQSDLNKIQSSKTYKLWQKYNSTLKKIKLKPKT